MQSLIDILGDKDFDVPEEITVIKTYIHRHFQKDVKIAIQSQIIVITVASAGLAGSLRPHLHKLQKTLATDKRLVIRIG
jgi:hypothetical protein